MEDGFNGWPHQSPQLSSSRTTSAATYSRLLLSGRPLNGQVELWRNSSLLTPTTDYTVSGREVTFTSNIGIGDVVTDRYYTKDDVGSSVLTGQVNSLYDVTLGLSPNGYWPMNETSGTTLTDATSNGRNGTYTGSPTLSQTPIFSKSSRCVLMTRASNQYAEYSGTAFDSYTTAWSIQAVFKLNTGTNNPIFAHKYSSRVPFAMMVGLDASASNRLAGGFYDGSWRLANYTTGLSTSTAYHCVVTWDGTTVTVYLNGSSVATATPGVSVQAENSSNGFRIGGYWLTATTNLLDGYVSDVAIWNSALNSTQVTSLYNSLT